MSERKEKALRLLFAVTVVIIIQRLCELALSRKNYLWVLAKGAREYGAEHLPLFIVLYSLWILSFNLEWFLLKPPVPQGWPFLAHAILTAQVLRYWAIVTLGRRWNTRILIIPEHSPISSGPYRFFRHPNYIAVCIEIAAIPALLGAWYTAAAFSLLNVSLLILIRMPAEDEQEVPDSASCTIVPTMVISGAAVVIGYCLKSLTQYIDGSPVNLSIAKLKVNVAMES